MFKIYSYAENIRVLSVMAGLKMDSGNCYWRGVLNRREHHTQNLYFRLTFSVSGLIVQVVLK